MSYRDKWKLLRSFYIKYDNYILLIFSPFLSPSFSYTYPHIHSHLVNITEVCEL